jgi:hypothetical protein
VILRRYTGGVRISDGAPAAGAEVAIVTDSQTIRTRCDRAGKFSQSVLPGKLTQITAFYDNLAPIYLNHWHLKATYRWLDSRVAVQADFVVPAWQSAERIVVPLMESRHGAPSSSFLATPQADFVTLTAESGDGGNFAFKGLPTGVYWITATGKDGWSLDSYAGKDGDWIPIDKADVETEISLNPWSRVGGRVTYPNGKPGHWH